jgi:hypothetical protein
VVSRVSGALDILHRESACVETETAVL